MTLTPGAYLKALSGSHSGRVVRAHPGWCASADRAIQLYDANGVTNDTPAARAFSKARAFRIYDGPDEVHLQTIARLEAAEQNLTQLDDYLFENGE